MPQLLALLPPQIATLESVRTTLLTTYSTMSGIIEQMEELGGARLPWGRISMPPKTTIPFTCLKRFSTTRTSSASMNLFLSPDGKAARFIITHRENPASEEGIARIDPIRTAAEESLKGTPLANAKIYRGRHWGDLERPARRIELRLGDRRDRIALHHLHHHVDHLAKLIAALVIVGTVVASLGAAFGLSVLVWQHILGINLHWGVLADVGHNSLGGGI